jgi:hypothetical protein
MNRATKIIELPVLTVDFLSAKGILIDNFFASLWRNAGMKTLLSRASFNKRSGMPMRSRLWINALDRVEERHHRHVCSERLAGFHGQRCLL